MNVGPTELRGLEFYTIENMLKEYENYVDQENKQYEKQQREAEKQQKLNTPNFGGTNFPKVKIPSY